MGVDRLATSERSAPVAALLLLLLLSPARANAAAAPPRPRSSCSARRNEDAIAQVQLYNLHERARVPAHTLQMERAWEQMNEATRECGYNEKRVQEHE